MKKESPLWHGRDTERLESTGRDVILSIEITRLPPSERTEKAASIPFNGRPLFGFFLFLNSRQPTLDCPYDFLLREAPSCALWVGSDAVHLNRSHGRWIKVVHNARTNEMGGTCVSPSFQSAALNTNRTSLACDQPPHFPWYFPPFSPVYSEPIAPHTKLVFPPSPLRLCQSNAREWAIARRSWASSPSLAVHRTMPSSHTKRQQQTGTRHRSDAIDTHFNHAFVSRWKRPTWRPLSTG